MIETELEKLIKDCEEISGQWDGDKPGYKEEQAMIANEIIEKAKEIMELIKELNGTNF